MQGYMEARESPDRFSSLYELFVFDAAHKVGTLTFDATQDTFGFVYDPSWVSRPDSYPLSPHIPLRGKVRAVTIRRFVENLLPEGQALDVAASAWGLSKGNLYGLIRRMGTETTGALSFQTENRPPQPADVPLRQVTAQELDKRIQERQQQPLAVWDGKVRISVAGLQDKMLVLVQNDRMHLAEHPFASTHLLKPEPLNPATPFMVANEHYCLTLARMLGLEAPDAAIGRLSTPYLLVPRFDRVPHKQRVERLHVLDGCQALDLPVSHKYERNLGQGRDVRHVRDGASFEGLFGLRRFFSQPALQTRALVRWAILSLLIGNSDAHGKNISFRVLPSGLTVAPFYDLVSVVQYDAGHLDHELAMAYGDEFELEKIAAFDLADFCQRCGLQRAYFARELSTLSRAAVRAAPQLVKSDVYTSEERDFVANIARFVMRQAGRLLELARTLPEVDKRVL